MPCPAPIYDRDPEPTTCTAQQPRKDADIHDGGTVEGDIFTCTDCGTTCEI